MNQNIGIYRCLVFYDKIRKYFRDIIISSQYRKRLKNDKFTIIASDCTGGLIYHELHKQFLSPTINMFMMANDYVRFCSEIKRWIDLPMVEVDQNEYPYPLALLGGQGGILLHLVHYKTVEEAQEKWNRRKVRINWENMYFLMNDRNNCSVTDISNFNGLPYKKVLLSHIEQGYKDIDCVKYVRGFENSNFIPVMASFCSRFSIRKNIDYFDFVEWLNE